MADTLQDKLSKYKVPSRPLVATEKWVDPTQPTPSPETKSEESSTTTNMKSVYDPLTPPSLKHESPFTFDKSPTFQPPDLSEEDKTLASKVGESRTRYEDERQRNAWLDLAQRIGSGLAQLGAGLEGQRKGVFVGPINTGTNVDYSGETKQAYKNYIDELTELRSVRDQAAKAKTDAAKIKFEQEARDRELKAKAWQDAADRNLRRDLANQSTTAEASRTKALNELRQSLATQKADQRAEMTPYQKAQIELSRERLANQDVASLQRDKALLTKVSSDKKLMDTSGPVVMKVLGVDPDEWHAFSSDEKNLKNAIAGKITELDNMIAEKRKMGEPGNLIGTQPPPSDTILVRAKSTGEIRRVTPKQLDDLLNGKYANEFEVIK